MKKFIKIFVLIILIISSINISLANPKVKKTTKKGVVSKVKNAAAYGFGWQLGKEGAKAAIKKGQEIAKDPKTKEKVKELKDKTKNLINKEKK